MGDFMDQVGLCMDWSLYRGHSEQALTVREQEIIALVCRGLSNKEVGMRLKIAEGTVKIHLYHIYKKVGVPRKAAGARNFESAPTPASGRRSASAKGV